jgi:hypothetical protein
LDAIPLNGDADLVGRAHAPWRERYLAHGATREVALLTGKKVTLVGHGNAALRVNVPRAA